MEFVPDPAYCCEYRVLPVITDSFAEHIINAAMPSTVQGDFGTIVTQHVHFDVLSVWYYVLQIDKEVLLHVHVPQPVFLLNFVLGKTFVATLLPGKAIEFHKGQFQLLGVPGGRYDVVFPPGRYSFLHLTLLQFLLQEFLHEYSFIKGTLLSANSAQPEQYAGLSLTIPVKAQALIEKIIGNRSIGVKGRIEIEHMAKELLVVSLDHLYEQVNAPRQMPDHDTMIILEVERFISDRLDEKITVDEICREFKTGRTKLYTLFKEVFGKSVHEYILFKRIEKAKELLQQGLSVSEVAVRMGFEKGNFTRTFKQQTGYNPSKYEAR